MGSIRSLSKIPKEFASSQTCADEFRESNRYIYKVWCTIMTVMNFSVILLSLYYILFVEGESEILGNYVYIGAYSFQIVVAVAYLKVFCNDTISPRTYTLLVDVFIYECMAWILFVSCMDYYYTGAYSAFVGGFIDMSILYLKPRKFNTISIVVTVLYCAYVLYINLVSLEDEFGSIVMDTTTLIEIVNVLFNVLILVFALVLFTYIKYSAKVSNIYNTHRLQELSTLDILTGLFNRMSLTHYIESVKSSKYSSIVIVMIDIDNFKRINDTYGHLVGDKCIHLMGEKIGRITSKGYRYGGEEFLIIFENLEVSQVCDVMETFRKDIEASEVASVRFTVSIGVSDSYKSTNVETIIEQADERLYKAKTTGKNRVVST